MSKINLKIKKKKNKKGKIYIMLIVDGGNTGTCDL